MCFPCQFSFHHVPCFPLTIRPDNEHQLPGMRLARGPDEHDDLLVGVLRHVAPIDEEDLVALVESRDAQVSRRVGSHPRHNDRHALVSAALQHSRKEAWLGWVVQTSYIV